MDVPVNDNISNNPQTSKLALIAVFVFGLILLPLLTHSLIDHPPEYDELLHVLSAKSLQETGEPLIADGAYPRAILYTKIVALVQQSGANELVLARLPALVAGAILIAFTAAWVALRAGLIAGLITAVILAIMPDTVHLSVLVRFYTLHALFMVIMLILVYESLRPDVSIARSAGLLAGAAVFFWLGMQLQILTQVTALACVTAAFTLLVFDWRKPVTHWVKTHLLITLIGLVALLAAGLYMAMMLDVIGKLRGVTPAWSVAKANDPFFYIKSFTPRLPMLWPLFPAIVLMAFSTHRRLTLYFLVVVLVSLFVSSMASQKATRYIYHMIPAICILYGLGIHSIVASMSRYAAQRDNDRIGKSRIPVIALLLTCALVSTEVQRAAKLVLARGTMDVVIPVNEEPDWFLSRNALADDLANAQTVIVSSGVKGLYAYGRYDFELSRTVIDDTDTKEEFGFDPRTGRYVISTPASVETVLSRPGSELFILENRMMNQTYSAPAETVAVLEEKCQRIQIPVESQLTAWSCL